MSFKTTLFAQNRQKFRGTALLRTVLFSKLLCFIKRNVTLGVQIALVADHENHLQITSSHRN